MAEKAPLRVLYLSKSSGYQHSVVTRDGDKLSSSELIVKTLGNTIGAEVTCTKDASLINAESLKNYDVVVFYTSGNLTESGTDKTTPMGPNGVAELVEWIEQGGGFVGFHAACDSYRGEGDATTPYSEMIGGEFAGHGKQFVGDLNFIDTRHPAVKRWPAKWTALEEWYTFVKLNTETMHVLAMCDPGEERTKQEMYNRPDYPLVWCRAQGEGRVYNNALGHRESVWEDKDFQLGIIDAIQWAGGRGRTKAKPNYDKVVPAEKK